MSTPILGMPELAAAQAIPETTVNEIARILEQGARWFVFLDRDLTAPPGSPADGDAYLVATGATGAWSGHDGEIAWRMSTAWEFIVPSEGFAGYVADEDVAITFDGSVWNALSADLSTTSIDDLADVNVGAPADGEALVWDVGAGEWVSAPLPGGGAGGTVPDGGSTGQVLTQASGVDQDVEWRGMSACRIKKSADQTAADYSATPAIAFDTEVIDLGAWFNSGSSATRITVPSGVSYAEVGGAIGASSLTNPSVNVLSIRKNGTEICSQFTSTATFTTGLEVNTGPLPVSSGDYFELFFYCSDTSITVEQETTAFWAKSLG